MCNVSVFNGSCGLNEVYFTLTSTPSTDFNTEADKLLNTYSHLLLRNGCSEETEIFLRFHLSDITNQAPLLHHKICARGGFVSVIGQAPVNGARIALEAWHFHKEGQPVRREQLSSDEFDVLLDNYRLMYHRTPKVLSNGSAGQTSEVFSGLCNALGARNGNLADNCIRTWLYCRDIDSNYAGLVNSRKELFKANGMNSKTHFIASTGIEGKSEEVSQVVGMDSLSLWGHDAAQVEFMHAPEHMSPTAIYGVTFERGTRIVYGDRSHYYISGTASIDREGNILHCNDAVEQTRRTVENIIALLNNHGATLDDLKIANVYIRDLADASAIERELDTLLPASLPRILVFAPVCRPGWLMEIDAIGVNANGNDAFPDFC